MANIKVVLRKEVKKDGSSPLAIRITKDRKSSYVYLEYSINPKDWDDKNQKVKKSHPNSVRFNNYLATKVAEALNKSLEIEAEKKNVTSVAVREKLKPTAICTFFAVAKTYLEDLHASGKYNQYTADKPRIKHFKDFMKGHDIAFADITVSLLEKFKVFLKGNFKKLEADQFVAMSDRTIINHLVVIRSVFSKAIKAGIIDKKYYPFGSDKIKIKFPESIKLGLSSDEVKALEQLDLSELPIENHARNLWLFSFYLAGMRVSDVFRLRWSDIQNDRLHYAMGKNAKSGSFKLPEKALAILKLYELERESFDDYIFPELKRLEKKESKFIQQRTIAFAASRIDKFLNKHIAPMIDLTKPLTMHIARHTFGNISGDKIPIQMLQKLYRHSSITTTIGYQSNFIHKDADEALDAVVSF